MRAQTRALLRQQQAQADLQPSPVHVAEAIFVAAEVADADLSHITMHGQAKRYVRKGKSVGTMTAGDLLLVMWSDSLLLTIVDVIVGDTSLATH